MDDLEQLIPDIQEKFESGKIDEASALLASARNLDLPPITICTVIEIDAKISCMHQNFRAASGGFLRLLEKLDHLNEKDRSSEILRKCASCIFLSAASTERNTHLKVLLEDQRARSLALYDVLCKCAELNLILDSDVPAILKEIRATLSFCTTIDIERLIKERIMTENIVVISLNFSDISTELLAKLSLTDENSALKACKLMISKRGLNARIDQPNDLIYFLDPSEDEREIDGPTMNLIYQVDHAAEHIKTIMGM